MLMQPIDRVALRDQFASARPFPHFKIDNFLVPEKALEIAQAYPDFETALSQGRTFRSANERKKIQITNSALYPKPIAELNELLASQEFLNDLSFITGMPNLLADDQLVGGGMHMTGPGGKLDVHVDFNYIEDRKLHRRLNLLVYLNPSWNENWGGHIQLWDRTVQNCEASFAPIMNRCVVFETNEISYHGVVPISPDAPGPRQSFATYYYTREAPAHWTGHSHSTIFKARPDEKYNKYVGMPIEKAQRAIRHGADRAKRVVKRLFRTG